MKDITKNYTNGEVTIVWKPNTCIHSENCFHGLSDVFNPNVRPWISPQRASTERIIEQIKKCPSGALSYYLNNESLGEEKNEQAVITIEPALNGPLMVHGDVMVKDASGNITPKGKLTAFCRCGASSNKPYCDGSHKKIGFQG